ncbi:hypothetical protein MXD81_03570 [Microbacteriaceae bacterium K1510]|nr:hypothetical protein [Microbacteriaceae bacterium K1510]
MSQGDERPLSPEQERFIARVRRMMAIASVTTFVAVGIVLAVIGYRLFTLQGSAPPAATGTQALPSLPMGAKVVSSAIGEGRLVLTIEASGGLELLSFDLATLKPLARQRLSPQP